MTPLKALLKDLTTYFTLIDKWRTDDPITAEQEIEISKLEKNIRKSMVTTITPPTADEVCEAISKLPIYKDDKITYNEKTNQFMCNDFAITDEDDIPIFILLGRFYEAQE